MGSANGPFYASPLQPPEALAWSDSSYPLQDGAGQLLSQFLLVVPEVAGLVLFVLWKEENEGVWDSWSQGSQQQLRGVTHSLTQG